MGSDIRTKMFYEKLKYEMLNYENIMIHFIMCSREKYLFQKLKKKVKSKIIDGKEISKDFISTLADFTTVAGNRKKRISRFRYLLDALNKDYSFRLKFSEDADVILLFTTRSY